MEETPRSVFLIVYTSKTDRLEKHLTENKFRLDDTQMDSTSTERFSNFKTVLAKRLVCVPQNPGKLKVADAAAAASFSDHNRTVST